VTDTYEFNREFRLKVLGLCLDDSWMAKYGDDIVRPEYFERDEEEAFVKAVVVFRKKYKRSPHDPTDVIELCDGGHTSFILDVYDLADDWDLSLASDLAVEFAREQAAKLAILDGVDDIAKGDIQSAIDKMKKALEVGQNIESPGIDSVGDVYSWLMDYWSHKVPTGWPHVDTILEGGPAPTELGIIMAPQNRGKSAALINIGHAAAGLMSGHNVVHFSHEMNSSQVAKRYAARMLFRFPKRNDNLYEYAEELIDTARKLLKGKIRIISGRKPKAAIEGHLNRLLAEGFEFGLILDDYPDLIPASRRYSDKRFELSDTYTWMRELGEHYGVPVWGASQSGRKSLTKEIITIGDIAEDIGKAGIADIIIALCQTYDEEQLDQCRLFMAKVRDGKKHNLIQCKYYPDQQAIISTGVIKYQTKKEDERDA
jgi:hypothetical protein